MITFATVNGLEPTVSTVGTDARYDLARAGDWLRGRPQLARETKGQVSVFGVVAFDAAQTEAVAVADARRLLMTDVHIPSTGHPAWRQPT